MAAALDSLYFPSLDKCLAGDSCMISWRIAYLALQDRGAAEDNTALEEFLKDKATVDNLLAAFNEPSPPDGDSKKDFETKTAPIHVSQSANGDYDLEQIKKDALWLSGELKVAELACLRIVILECQQRNADQLLATAGDTGIRRAAADFHVETARRQRMIRIYLEERVYLVKLGADLIGHYATRDAAAKYDTWIDELAAKVAQASVKERESRILSSIKSIRERRSQGPPKHLQSFPELEDAVLFFNLHMTMATLRYVLVLVYTLDSITSSEVILAWFSCMDRSSFLLDLVDNNSTTSASSVHSLVAIISFALLQVSRSIVLQQEQALAREDDVSYPQLGAKPYCADDKCLEELNIIFYHAAEKGLFVASPAIFAWSLVTLQIRNLAVELKNVRHQQLMDEGDESGHVRARAASGDGQSSRIEDRHNSLQPQQMREAGDDPPVYFAQVAVDQMGVYNILPVLSESLGVMHRTTAVIGRELLYTLWGCGFELVGYQEEVLGALLALLASEQSPTFSGPPTLCNKLMSDSGRPMILDQSISRYPYELSPVLRLSAALTAATSEQRTGPADIVQILENFTTVTVMVPEHFRAYQLENEDENTNAIVLTKDLYLFRPRQSLHSSPQRLLAKSTMTDGEDDEANSVVVCGAGTSGMVIREERPMVIKLEHQHSSLEYFGLLLSTLLPNSAIAPASLHAEADCSTAADIVALITALLTASLRQDEGVSEANYVLGRLSYALPGEADIISTIVDIFEMELLAHLDHDASEGSLDLVVACAECFTCLIKVSPERIWPPLSRSALLGASGGASALAAIVAGTEVAAGQFKFLLACTRMFARLVDDAMNGLVRRKARQTKATNRFDSPIQAPDSTPERTMSAVLVAYQRVMLDAFRNMTSWRFAVPDEKHEVAILMMSAFHRLLRATYGLEPPTIGKRERVTAILTPSAEMLLQTFAPESGGSALLSTVSELFTDALSICENVELEKLRLKLARQVNVWSDFLASLLLTARAVDVKRAASLGAELMNEMPKIAILFAADHTLKSPLALLLSEIVQSTAAKDAEPPSMLSNLTQEAAKAFLAVVTQLDRPLCDVDVEVNIWDLLSAVLGERQAWFGTYLLTGTLPRTQLKECDNSSSSHKRKSLLTYALDELSTISMLNPERAKAMLKFVATAQTVWIKATNEVRSHSSFVKNMLEWVNGLQPPAKAASNTKALLSANEHHMAATLCDILAVAVQVSLEAGDKTLLAMLVKNLSFLCRHAVNVDSYNRSLHMNLAENLKAKYPLCEVADFKRTTANPAPYGKTFYYDLQLADEILGHDVAWSGALNGRGFEDEVRRANVNLSLVDAQATLLRSWTTLATVLSDWIQQDALLPSTAAASAAVCLRANAAAHIDEPGSADTLEHRAQLAFILLSKLVSIQSSEPAMKELLPAAWGLVRTTPVDYDVATAPEDLDYYRLLLQTLYMSLQPHIYQTPISSKEPTATDTDNVQIKSAATAACLLDIVRKAVAPAFRALCGNLHENLRLATPGDFALITSLLQAVLSVADVSSVQAQIADEIASSNIIRGALSLYSWADHLAEVMDQDPVYGEIAITFLVALSRVPAVAEQMALGGVLAQLSSANLSDYFRKANGKGPFDEPRRMFVIWTEGFLPLCMNLLDAVGPPVAAEVVAFLNSFPEQLARAELAFETELPRQRQRPHSGDVTLGLVTEAHSLVMIGLTLQSDSAMGAAEGIDAANIPQLSYDVSQAKTRLEALPRNTRSLRDRIVSMNEVEVEWTRMESSVASDNLLMEKVLKEVHGTLECFGDA